MMELLMDILRTLLLIAAVGFGAISVIGLLIFPDIRSRSFTGLRAGILSLAFVAAAAVSYGLYTWVVTGELQYLLFTFIAITALVLVFVLNRKADRTFCQTVPQHPAGNADQDHNG